MPISNLSNGLRTGVCTSTNRPTTPYEGQVIYETDTDKVLVWNGTAWIGGAVPMTFTTEAVRDAAIIAPSEGMTAYLTAPTIPAATGEYTKLPTGIQTVYNGTNWTCITPIAAETTTGGTTTSGSYTPTLTSGGTNPSVTLTTGTTAIVSIRNRAGGPGTAGYFFYQTAVAVSGATTLAAADRWGITSGNTATAPSGFGATFIMTGLTAGTNTFTMQYVVNSGTGTFSFREIIVAGCL